MLLLWENQFLVLAITESDFYEIGSEELMELPPEDDNVSNSITLDDPPFSFYGKEQTCIFVSYQFMSFGTK